ncbi:hypothetical protein SAMN04488519_101372 [Algoriphagus ornithinivorans]|uniref:Uncharacterized protein n=1 Tax=Algoriphagus ornithinivorans TaxID=226506 RepID=A0A1I5B3R4_9BACT|nr:hypothetical protein [Algoriphagus ornithinivorans]SFN69260.1 hypothetical protein SAMN04488519_101372 [Algoriphagus ornithinivorans]
MKYCWIVFFLLPLRLFAQEAVLSSPIADWEVNQLSLVSFDTKDQIFASNIQGDIFLFDSKGIEKNYFSPPHQGQLHQLEAAWTVNIFTFSSDLQQYRILDRFLNPLAENGFLQVNVTLAKAATLGNNNVIWIWDESDFSLKRLDYLRNTILDSQPLNLILNSESLSVTEIREFKNRLFMNIPSSGVYVFDNQGNFIKKFDLKNQERLCYFQEQLLWLEDGFIWTLNLQTLEKRPAVQIPNAEFEGIQIGQEFMTLTHKNRIQVFRVPQELKQKQ